MLINAVNNYSFKGATKENSKNPTSKTDDFFRDITYAGISSTFRDTINLSKNREVQYGKFFLARSIALVSGALLLYGSIIKNIGTKKPFGIQAGGILILAAALINVANSISAKKTEKERGVNSNGIITTPKLEQLQKEAEEINKAISEENSKAFAQYYQNNIKALENSIK